MPRVALAALSGSGAFHPSVTASELASLCSLGCRESLLPGCYSIQRATDLPRPADAAVATAHVRHRNPHRSPASGARRPRAVTRQAKRQRIGMNPVKPRRQRILTTTTRLYRRRKRSIRDNGGCVDHAIRDLANHRPINGQSTAIIGALLQQTGFPGGNENAPAKNPIRPLFDRTGVYPSPTISSRLRIVSRTEKNRRVD